MKVDVVSLEGKKVKSIDLPVQFSEDYEPNLIKRAMLAVFSHNRQPYGAMSRAGKNSSGKLSRRRRDYKGSYGKGMSRVPRKTMWRRGTQFGWVGTFISGTVGGRRAHPPKVTKNWNLKINEKERKKAIRSAMAGVANQGKLMIVEDKITTLKKVKEVKDTLIKLGFETDAVKRKRAGRGKSRGREIRYKKNALVVVDKNCDLLISLANLPGYDIVNVRNLNANLLSLNFDLPRKCIFTESAINLIDKEKLFGVKK